MEIENKIWLDDFSLGYVDNEETDFDMFKETLFEFIEDFNNQDSMFKITYYEIFYDTYYLYIEDTENEIEYQSENNISNFKNCGTKNDYKSLMYKALEKDLEKLVGEWE